MIEKLIGSGADVQALRADLQTPLHLSVLKGDYWFNKTNHPDGESAREVTDYLLEHGAEYEFSVAVARGDRERVEAFLEKDPGIGARLNPSRYSPLGLAARGRHLEIACLLLDHGADPNLAEECCDSGAALFEACARNDVEMVRLLLDHGANPNAESDSSGNCLTIAEHQRNEHTPEVHALLRESGARESLWQLDTPEEILERIRNDESLDPDDAYWGGILQRVLAVGDGEVLNAFVERFGTEPIRTLDPANGWNVVSSPSILDELIRHGMDINRRDWWGQTYLHALAGGTKLEDAGLYIDRGIDLNAIDHVNGTTARGVAAMHGNTEMEDYLRQRGAGPGEPKDRA